MLQGRSQERDEIDPDFTKICDALGHQQTLGGFFLCFLCDRVSNAMPRLTLSGQSDRTRLCPLLGNSGQRMILALSSFEFAAT
jgi:hypothetical protein